MHVQPRLFFLQKQQLPVHPFPILSYSLLSFNNPSPSEREKQYTLFFPPCQYLFYLFFTFLPPFLHPSVFITPFLEKNVFYPKIHTLKYLFLLFSFNNPTYSPLFSTDEIFLSNSRRNSGVISAVKSKAFRY